MPQKVKTVKCWECGNAFQGNAKTHYCCNACKQRAYRKRNSVTKVPENVT